MIESVAQGLILGLIFTIVAHFVPHFYLVFMPTLACNVLFYYILNRFICPKTIFATNFLKSYFLGFLIGFIIIWACIFMLDFYNYHIVDFLIDDLYVKLRDFIAPFVGLLYLKAMIFFISWRILGFVFKEEYKAYRIKDFVVSKQPPNKKAKYTGLTLGIFFALSNIDILPFMMSFEEGEVLMPIVRCVQFFYQYVYLKESLYDSL